MGSSVIKNTRRIVSTGNELGALASGYIPYIGAVSDVSLGAHKINLSAYSPGAATNGDIWYDSNTTTGFNLYSNDATNTGNAFTVSNAATSIAFYLANAGSTPAQIGSSSGALGLYSANGAPKIRIATSGKVAINSTTDATTNFWVNGNTNLGNAVTTTQRQLRIGEGSSYIDFGEISATFGGIWFQTLNPTSTTYSFGGDGSYAIVNAPSLAVLLRSAGTTFASGTSSLSSVSGGQFSLTALTSLANTANSSVQKFISNGASTQWSSGTTAAQYENNFTSPTYSGVAATTLTIAATVVADFPIASTNMTITSSAAFYNPTRVLTASTGTGYGALFNAPSGATANWAIGAIGSVTSTIGYGVGATPSSSRPINLSASVAGEYSILITNANSGASAIAGIRLGNNSNQSVIGQGSTGATTGNGLYPNALNFIQSDYGFAFNQSGSGTASGALTRFRIWGAGNTTNQTLSTEIQGFIDSSFSRQWATGTIALQRERHFQTVTYSFVGASTITLAGSLSVDYLTSGTNSTITTSSAIYIPTASLANTTTGIGLNIEGPTTATNKYAAKFTQGTGTLLFGEYTAGRAAIWVNQTDAGASSTNWAFSGSGTSTTFINAATTINMLIGGSINATFTSLLCDFGGGQASYNLSFTSTAGTKLGTATSQKIAFWNATPIVQPTTAIAASTFAANTSLIANDTATWDGYTVGQVVKALRNSGLLA